MTELRQGLRDGRPAHPARTAIVIEYAVVLGLILLLGAVALAEVSGVMDSFVHSITFAV